MKALQAFEPGDAVGPYVVQDLLGQGGMAAVYRVRHEKLDSVHALKVVTVPSRSVMKRLMLEGKVQARLAHRHIVAVTDVIEVQGCPGLVMEYIRGPSLDGLLERMRLPLPVIDVVVRGLLRGLAAAHRDGVVHRDLKPANVLLSLEDDGLIAKIADFGLVKEVSADGSATKSGAFMGTPSYMAPEQIRSAKDVDARADLFAVGAITYELLTGRLAFPGDDMLDIFNAIAAGRYEPLPAGLPQRMVDATAAALTVDRDARVASAEDLLERWCGDVADAELPSGRELLPTTVLTTFDDLQPAPAGSMAARRRLSTTRDSRDSAQPSHPPLPTPAPTSVAPAESGRLAAVAGLLLTGLLRFVLLELRDWTLAQAETRLAVDGAAEMFRHVLRLPVAFFGARYAGEIATRLSLADGLARLLTNEAAEIALNLIAAVFFLALMLAYDPVIALVVVVMSGLNLVAVLSAARIIRDGHRKISIDGGKLAGVELSGIQDIETFKAAGAEDAFFARWSGLHANLTTAAQAMGRRLVMVRATPGLLSALTSAAVLIMGGWQVMEGAMTIGALVAFQTLAASFTQPVLALTGLGAQLQDRHRRRVVDEDRRLAAHAVAQRGGEGADLFGRFEIAREEDEAERIDISKEAAFGAGQAQPFGRKDRRSEPPAHRVVTGMQSAFSATKAAQNRRASEMSPKPSARSR